MNENNKTYIFETLIVIFVFFMVSFFVFDYITYNNIHIPPKKGKHTQELMFSWQNTIRHGGSTMRGITEAWCYNRQGEEYMCEGCSSMYWKNASCTGGRFLDFCTCTFGRLEEN